VKLLVPGGCWIEPSFIEKSAATALERWFAKVLFFLAISRCRLLRGTLTVEQRIPSSRYR
jgi:hypothetical protein